MLFLGIDLGTGGVRCLLVNEVGEIWKTARTLTQINTSQIPGHSEQEASEWIKILEDALDQLFANPINRDVCAVSVDSTSGTILPVSPTECSRKALLHNDVRAIKEAKKCVSFLEVPVRRLFLSLKFYGCNII